MLVLFLPKVANQEPKDLSGLISLDIWALLKFISVDILLEFLVLVVFLFIFNIIPVLLFAAAFNLFNCVFVHLTLSSW